MRPNESTKIGVEFIDRIQESQTNLVTFETDQGYQYNLILDIEVIESKPSIQFLEEIRNFGAADYSRSEAISQTIAIKNTGVSL